MIPKKHGRVAINAVDGREYSGYYHVDNGWITVNAQGRSRKSQLSSPDSDLEPLAAMLLQEIVNDSLR